MLLTLIETPTESIIFMVYYKEVQRNEDKLNALNKQRHPKKKKSL